MNRKSDGDRWINVDAKACSIADFLLSLEYEELDLSMPIFVATDLDSEELYGLTSYAVVKDRLILIPGTGKGHAMLRPETWQPSALDDQDNVDE